MARMWATACAAAALSGSVASAPPPPLRAQTCQVVPGQRLESFYPAMPGWVRETPQSETDIDESVSRTTVDFERGVSTISVELMDSCRNPDVLALILEALKQLPPATSGTVLRHLTVNSFPGYEEWTDSAGNGEVHVLVAGRFVVKVTASRTDRATLQSAAQSIPMQKLAAIK